MIKELLKRIDDFCLKKGIKDTTFGLYSAGSGAFVQRLRDNKSVELGTLQRVDQYLKDNSKKEYKKCKIDTSKHGN